MLRQRVAVDVNVRGGAETAGGTAWTKRGGGQRGAKRRGVRGARRSRTTRRSGEGGCAGQAEELRRASGAGVDVDGQSTRVEEAAIGQERKRPQREQLILYPQGFNYTYSFTKFPVPRTTSPMSLLVSKRRYLCTVAYRC